MTIKIQQERGEKDVGFKTKMGLLAVSHQKV